MSSNPLRLYKSLLRGLQTFPSKNASKLYTEIRLEFKSHKTLSGKVLEAKIQEAKEGILHLSQYNGLSKTSSNWSITSTQNPMPQKPKKE